MHIFVGNLACTATDQDLRQLFEPYGAVDTIEMITDPETGHPCGVGFVEMPERSTARAAIVGLHGTDLGGRVARGRSRPDQRRSPCLITRRPSRVGWHTLCSRPPPYSHSLVIHVR